MVRRCQNRELRTSSGIRLAGVWRLASRHPAYRRRDLCTGFHMESQEPVVPMPRERHERQHRKCLSTDAGHRGGGFRSSEVAG